MSSFSGFLYRRSAESFIGSCDDVEMRSFDEGETRSDLYRVERFTSEALHSLSSIGFRCCCYHWTRGASARTVSQEVTENEDILKFGSLIVLSNTQDRLSVDTSRELRRERSLQTVCVEPLVWYPEQVSWFLQ